MRFDIATEPGPDGSLIATLTERPAPRLTSRNRRRMRRLQRVIRREITRQFLGKAVTPVLLESLVDVTERMMDRHQHLYH